MGNGTTQIKFTIESGTVSDFRTRCAGEGVSMTSAIRRFMGESASTGVSALKVHTRPQRRKTVERVISLLKEILRREEEYRDAIPEPFDQRRDAADSSCDCLAEAIGTLEEAFL